MLEDGSFLRTLRTIVFSFFTIAFFATRPSQHKSSSSTTTPTPTMPGLIGKVPTFPKTYNVYFLAIISTVGGMLFGFDISSMSAIVGTQQYLDYFGNPAGSLQGAIGSALAAGSIIGCLIAGPISDRIGRRDACMFGTSSQERSPVRGDRD